jgi:hypothetical protein
LNSEIVAMPNTDGLTIEINTTDNTIRLKQQVGQAKDSSGNNTFREFLGASQFSSGSVTFNGYVAQMSAQPSTLAGFNDLTLVTKGYVDGIYARKTVVTGSINSSNKTFTFSNPLKTGSEAVYLNGLLQTVTSDYTTTLSGSLITGVTFIAAPLTGSRITTYGVY